MAKLDKQPGEVFLRHGHFSHLSEWLPLVQDLTFETVFVELTDAEARALLKLISFSKSLARAEQIDGAETPDAFAMLSEDARQQLWSLQVRIDDALERLSKEEDGRQPGAHVRLNARSPKDGVFLIPKLTQLLRMAVLDQKFDSPWSCQCQQYDIASFHRCIIGAQEIRSGCEVFELLRFSQRIEADLVLGQVANAGDASSRLILRRWDSRVDPLNEVRVFVCGGRVTAISQYIESIVVPALLRHSEQVERLVCEATAEVHRRIEHLVPQDPFAGAPFYSADFVMIPDPDESCGFKDALLIEINPPPPVAGTVLFDWKKEGDRAILIGRGDAGTDSTCVRLVKKQMPWTKVDFHPPAKQLVDALRGRRRRKCCLWLPLCHKCRQRTHSE